MTNLMMQMLKKEMPAPEFAITMCYIELASDYNIGIKLKKKSKNIFLEMSKIFRYSLIWPFLHNILRTSNLFYKIKIEFSALRTQFAF